MEDTSDVTDALIEHADSDNADLQSDGGVQSPVDDRKFSVSYVAHGEDSLAGSSMRSLSKLKKELGLLSAVSLIAGTIIGSGIFLTPNGIVHHVGSDAMALVVWVLAGIVVVMASLCYAELGTAIPLSGGEYAYLRHAFGGLPAFLYCWTSTMVVRPVSSGIILLTFARYVSSPFFDESCPAPPYTFKLIAVACVVFLTTVGCLSAKWSSNVTSLLLAVKLLAIAFLIVLGVVALSQGKYGDLPKGFQNTTLGFGSLAFAFYDSLWAYDGWNNANYVTGELKDPKLLPVALVIAIPLVILCYLCVNIAYMSILPVATFVSSKAIAVDASHDIIGYPGLVIMPLLVAASCLGAANGTLFSGARVSAASARRGDLPRAFGLIHDTYCTPFTAYLVQCLVTIFYIVAVDINSLILFFSFVAWLFYGSSMVVLIVLRRREPDLPRMFKVPLALPVIVLLFAVFLVVTPFYQYPVKSASALAFLILSVPLYFIFVTRQLIGQCSQNFDKASDWTVRSLQYFMDVS